MKKEKEEGREEGRRESGRKGRREREERGRGGKEREKELTREVTTVFGAPPPLAIVVCLPTYLCIYSSMSLGMSKRGRERERETYLCTYSSMSLGMSKLMTCFT